MSKTIPPWALRAATPDDHALAQAAYGQGTLQITWPDAKTVRTWAKHQGWPTPWIGFEAAFIAHMLATSTHFALAITQSGVGLSLPKQGCTITDETIRELDALYEQRSPSGRPQEWERLVEELRAIRRAVEVGVVIHIAGEQPIRNWQQFYAWAHGRYHMLEDGSDKWIGDDA